MDETVLFNRMCLEAKEIQKLWDRQLIGDIVSVAGTIGVIIQQETPEITIDVPFRVITTSKNKVIWLPRQDQLQNIVQGKRYYRVLERFYQWYILKIVETSLLEKFKSLEQLWLAFVMKEKFNKKWDGEKWEQVSCL